MPSKILRRWRVPNLLAPWCEEQRLLRHVIEAKAFSVQWRGLHIRVILLLSHGVNSSVFQGMYLK